MTQGELGQMPLVDLELVEEGVKVFFSSPVASACSGLLAVVCFAVEI